MGSASVDTGQAATMKVTTVFHLVLQKLFICSINGRLPNIFDASFQGQRLNPGERFSNPDTFLQDDFYGAQFNSPEFGTFFPLNAIIEKFPDSISMGKKIVKEDTSEDIMDNQVELVLEFIAEAANSVDDIPDIPQIASAEVPDQDNPEKYINTDKDTLGKVFIRPFYYIDTNVFKIRGI